MKLATLYEFKFSNNFPRFDTKGKPNKGTWAIVARNQTLCLLKVIHYQERKRMMGLEETLLTNMYDSALIVYMKNL